MRCNVTTYEYQKRHIQQGLELRYNLLEFATQRLAKLLAEAKLPPSDGAFYPTKHFALPSLCIWQLATIDVFVEKAQHFLTERADKQERYGKLAAFCTLIAMASSFAFALWYVVSWAPPASLQSQKAMPLVINFLEFLALLGPLLGIAYFFTSLARAFFHEATILRNRRHSVRLGRLLLHLKVSSATSAEALTDIIKELDITEMERSFGWNLETSTAFKDINAEAMTTSLIAQLSTAVQKLSDARKPEKSRDG